MKTIILASFVFPATLAFGALAIAVGCTGNPPRQISHSESDTGHWLDSGRTKDSETVVKNSDGSVTTTTVRTTTPPKQ